MKLEFLESLFSRFMVRCLFTKIAFIEKILAIFVLMFIFIDGCMEYLDEWMKHLQFLKEFAWISLDKPPVWSEIDKSARTLIEKGIFPAEKHQQLFHNCSILIANINSIKIAENKEKKLTIGERWVDFFNKCDKEEYNCDALIRLVSYVLSIPGKFDYFFKLILNSLSSNIFRIFYLRLRCKRSSRTMLFTGQKTMDE